MSECPEMVQASLRKTWEKLGKFLVFSVRPREFVDAERVGSDQKTLFFDQNRVGLKPGALGRVNLILGAAVGFPVEMDQRVVESHPNVTIHRINPECRQNLPQ